MRSLSQIAKFLKKIRKDAGLKQRDMKLKAGIDQRHYSKYELTGQMNLETFFRILDSYGLEIDVVPRSNAPNAGLRLLDNANNIQDTGHYDEESDVLVQLRDLADD